MAETQRFSLTEVLDFFRDCLTDQGDILMDRYLDGWRGLIKFMNSLGSVFSFISRDAVSKIQIMENYRSGESRDQYLTLQSMVRYEMDNQLVDLVKRNEHWDSGCRTTLRLHRALRWLQLFLGKLQTASEDSKTSLLCTEAYNDSLAHHHSWIVRKAATVAFYVLPTRGAFFEVMNMGTAEEVVAKLGEALPYVSKVFDITEELYRKHALLNLP